MRGLYNTEYKLGDYVEAKIGTGRKVTGVISQIIISAFIIAYKVYNIKTEQSFIIKDVNTIKLLTKDKVDYVKQKI